MTILEVSGPVGFTDDELDRLPFDRHLVIKWAVCPFCGLRVATGTRKDTRNLSIVHEAIEDVRAPGEAMAGCERFRALSSTNLRELAQCFRSARIEWRMVPP